MNKGNEDQSILHFNNKITRMEEICLFYNMCSRRVKTEEAFSGLWSQWGVKLLFSLRFFPPLKWESGVSSNGHWLTLRTATELRKRTSKLIHMKAWLSALFSVITRHIFELFDLVTTDLKYQSLKNLWRTFISHQSPSSCFSFNSVIFQIHSSPNQNMHTKIITDLLNSETYSRQTQKKTHRDFFTQERQKQMIIIFLKNNLKTIRSNKKNWSYEHSKKTRKRVRIRAKNWVRNSSGVIVPLD